MKKLVLLLVLGTASLLPAQIVNGGGASTNPTTGTIPVKSGASTFGDSHIVDSANFTVDVSGNVTANSFLGSGVWSASSTPAACSPSAAGKDKICMDNSVNRLMNSYNAGAYSSYLLATDYGTANGVAQLSSNSDASNTLDSRQLVYIEDEFISGNTSNGTLGALGWTFGSLANTVFITGVANHPGLMQLTSSASSGVAGNFQLQNSQLLASGTAWKVRWILAWDTTTVNTVAGQAQTTVRFGLGDASGGDPFTNGIYFENISTTGTSNWNGIVRKASSNTTSGGSTALDITATYYTCDITNDGSDNIKFFINGVQYGSTVVAAGVIPVVGLTPYFYIKPTEAHSKIFDVDFFSLRYAVTR